MSYSIWLLRDANGTVEATAASHLDNDMLVATLAFQADQHPDSQMYEYALERRVRRGEPLPHGYTLTLEALTPTPPEA